MIYFIKHVLAFVQWTDRLTDGRADREGDEWTEGPMLLRTDKWTD